MRTLIAILLGLVLLGCERVYDAPTAPTRVSSNLRSAEVINSGPRPCDRQMRRHVWRNPGPDRRLRAASLWMGTSFGFRGDLQQGVYRISDASRLLPGGSLDRYREPLSQDDMILSRDFSHDHFLIKAGDGIVVEHVCVPVVPGAFESHVSLTIFWEQS